MAVWDVRRSYIPLASFMSHSDDVTGMTCYHVISRYDCVCALQILHG